MTLLPTSKRQITEKLDLFEKNEVSFELSASNNARAAWVRALFTVTIIMD